MTPPSSKSAFLIVEGKDDSIVIQTLFQQHAIAENFEIKDRYEDANGGKDKLLASIPVLLKTRGLTALGIVMDADQDISASWEALLYRLSSAGYQNLPKQPHSPGTIIFEEDKPKIGIWLMPDNQANGMLEDFLSYLVPVEDQLLPIARNTLAAIESSNLNKYSLAHHSKALIHTWLAWQSPPGRPFGTAITVNILTSHQPLALLFIEWVKRLFEDSPEVS